MIQRFALKRIQRLGKQFPVVLTFWARQSGKTTLARHFLKGEYFDLEKPSDQQIFLHDIEYALRRFKEPLILDEAQTLPELFPVLRALIDEQRDKKGRYFLLGSVNPVLIKQISESLAGRVGICELTPFLYPELKEKNDGISFEEFWLKGGVPDATLSNDLVEWQTWQENYIRTFVERDIARFRLKMSAIQIRQFMGLLAHYHGNLFNASEISKSFGISYHTVNAYLDLLEGHFLVRRLRPFYVNIKKRLVKSPKFYIRDSGVLHYLLGVSSERMLLESPKRGSSFEGFMIEQIITLEELRHEGARFYFYRTHAGAEINLIVELGPERIGFEFKSAVSLSKNDWRNLKDAIAEGFIQRGIVIYLGERSFDVAENISIIPAKDYLQQKASFIA